VVDLKPVKPMKRPVTLAEIKAEKRLANLQLVRLSRLSVSAVTPEEYKVIMEMGETK
jgi:predicted RNA-binding protein with PUA-like domain